MAIVIVGASLAAVNAAETLRSEGYSSEIILVGEESDPPYERPPLSKGFLLGQQELQEAFVHPPDWYREQSIDLRLGCAVTGLELDDRSVRLSSGERLRYDKVLLATGARPRRVDLAGAHYLRDIGDSTELKARLIPGAHVVILGAGWIGLEVAAAARTHGAQVTVVEMDSLPLRRVLGDEVASFYRDLHLSHDVKFHFGQSVVSCAAHYVSLDDGTTIPADLLCVGVGVVPAVELAEAAGLEVGNGIVVSESLQTSSPDVYACGDVANWFNPLIGARMRVEHWENARQSGMAAARAMLGQTVAYDWIPYFYSDQYDAGMEYSGWVGPDGYDEVVFRGSPAEGEFLAFWLKEGRVLAGMNVNMWDVQDDIRALIRAGYAEGRTVDTARLADPDAPLGRA